MPEGTISETDFRVLGLKAGAKPSEVKRAYRILAKKWHPDRHHFKSYESRAMAEEKFREINEAYVRISSEWEKPRRPARAEPRVGRNQAASAAAGVRPGRVREQRQGTRPPARPRHFVRSAFLALIFLVVLFEARTFYFNTGDEFEAPQRGGLEERSREDLNSPLKSLEAEPLQENLMSSFAPAPAPDPLIEPSAGPSKSSFTVGSTKSEVQRIQGAPSRVQGQTWTYGMSEVLFRNDRVRGYNNFDGSLKVRMEPRNVVEGPARAHITIGSTEDEVLLVQGTPTRIEQDRWYYGFAEIRFKDGRVREFDNYFGLLKVRVAPSENVSAAQLDFFTVGSTSDEVLAVQGTPTGILGNVWSYDFSYVFFRDGKVRQVSDSEGRLRFVSPENPADAPAR